MSFVICANCQQRRALDHMAKSGTCVFCPRSDAPRLLAPPAPLPVTRREPEDAVDRVLKQVRERTGS